MYLFFLLFFIPKVLFTLELNLICTNNYSSVNEVDVKDIFLLIDSETKEIDLGGLSFIAKEILVTKSNISWTSSNIQIYPDSEGEISGIIGRYSGDLVLNFKRYNNRKVNSLAFNCRKFEIKEKKF